MTFDVRLFTGLSLPPEMSAKFGDLLAELRPLARINWSPLPELHITTKFIGQWPFARLSELGRYLRSQSKPGMFPVTVTGLRYMPGPNRQGWILHACVEPSEGLSNLAAALDEQLTLFKIARERNEYKPHVTIGKIPGANPWPELDAKVDQCLEIPFGSFEVTEYHLYQSTPAGYRICETIPLL